MHIARLKLLALAMAGCAILFVAQGWADDETQQQVRFAAPKLIKAGSANLGEGRYYPSPVMQDMNGDGRLDLVVGDLIGKVTVAHAAAADGQPAFGAEVPLNDRDGSPLRFHNW